MTSVTATKSIHKLEDLSSPLTHTTGHIDSETKSHDEYAAIKIRQINFLSENWLVSEPSTSWCHDSCGWNTRLRRVSYLWTDFILSQRSLESTFSKLNCLYIFTLPYNANDPNTSHFLETTSQYVCSTLQLQQPHHIRHNLSGRDVTAAATTGVDGAVIAVADNDITCCNGDRLLTECVAS